MTTRTLPATWSLPRLSVSQRRLLDLAGMAVVLVFFGIFAQQFGGDSWAYYRADLLDPYRDSVYQTHTFFYSPAFNLAFEPLRWLPWGVSHVGIVALEIGALVWMVGWPVAAVLFLMDLEPMYVELANANLNLVTAALVIVALRFPWVWSWMLLTKVTPFIGVVWHVVRGEWRAVAWAIGATLLFALPTLILWPGQWVDWVVLLSGIHVGFDTRLGIGVPIRGAVALALIVWGARTDRMWTVPVAVAMSMPVTWVIPIMALGVWRLYRDEAQRSHVAPASSLDHRRGERSADRSLAGA